MTVTYEQATDVLYFLLDAEARQVRCQELSEDVILDLGPDDRIVGIEILDASKRLRLEQFLTLEYQKTDGYRLLRDPKPVGLRPRPHPQSRPHHRRARRPRVGLRQAPSRTHPIPHARPGLLAPKGESRLSRTCGGKPPRGE